MRRVLFSFTVSLLLGAGCGGREKKMAPAAEVAACDCSATREECSCSHCVMQESGMEAIACPCSARDARVRARR